MQQKENSSILRIFISEDDKSGHQPLYEAIVFAARKQSLAGATVMKGIMSYGAAAKIHTAKLIEISECLPVIVEIIDEETFLKMIQS